MDQKQLQWQATVHRHHPAALSPICTHKRARLCSTDSVPRCRQAIYALPVKMETLDGFVDSQVCGPSNTCKNGVKRVSGSKETLSLQQVLLTGAFLAALGQAPTYIQKNHSTRSSSISSRPTYIQKNHSTRSSSISSRLKHFCQQQRGRRARLKVSQLPPCIWVSHSSLRCASSLPLLRPPPWVLGSRNLDADRGSNPRSSH